MSQRAGDPQPAGARRRSTRRLRWPLAAVECLVGAGAVYGGLALLTDAEGMGARRAWLEGSIFGDYTVPGLVLLVVVGGGMLAAAAITLVAPRHAARAALPMGAVLLAWGLVETVTLGWRGIAQLVLVAAFIVVPAAVLLTASGRASSGWRRRSTDDGRSA